MKPTDMTAPTTATMVHALRVLALNSRPVLSLMAVKVRKIPRVASPDTAKT
jgi:hypothetical protein